MSWNVNKQGSVTALLRTLPDTFNSVVTNEMSDQERATLAQAHDIAQSSLESLQKGGAIGASITASGNATKGGTVGGMMMGGGTSSSIAVSVAVNELANFVE